MLDHIFCLQDFSTMKNEEKILIPLKYHLNIRAILHIIPS